MIDEKIEFVFDFISPWWALAPHARGSAHAACLPRLLPHREGDQPGGDGMGRRQDLG